MGSSGDTAFPKNFCPNSFGSPPQSQVDLQACLASSSTNNSIASPNLPEFNNCDNKISINS